MIEQLIQSINRRCASANQSNDASRSSRIWYRTDLVGIPVGVVLVSMTDRFGGRTSCASYLSSIHGNEDNRHEKWEWISLKASASSKYPFPQETKPHTSPEILLPRFVESF